MPCVTSGTRNRTRNSKGIEEAKPKHMTKSHGFMANRWGNSERLFWGAPKSLQMVTAAMKLKDAYSLEEKLCPT